MKRELGIARCGLACCLCSENEHCNGCNSGECPGKDWCENRNCSIENNYTHCYECKSECRKGLLSKIKPYGFTLFIKRYGEKALLDCLERNEKAGVVYHREGEGIHGDYDDFNDVEELIKFIKTGKNDINKTIINAVIKKAETLCPDSLALIGIYGSAATGDEHKKSDLDLLILINDKNGWVLADGFILDDIDVGYDIYCTSWDMLESDAQCNHAHLSKLFDSVIVYCKDKSSLKRLDEIRKDAAGLLASDRRYDKADFAYCEAKKKFAESHLTESLSKVRSCAGAAIMFIEDAVMLYNGRYFRKGTKRTFDELRQLDLPFDPEVIITDIIRAETVEKIRSGLTELFVLTNEYLKIPKQKALPAAANLGGTYEEMYSNWKNKMTEAADRDDMYSSFMNLLSLQEMIHEIAEEIEVDDFEIMDKFDPQDLENNVRVFDKAMSNYLAEYEKVGMRPKRYGSVEEFEKDYCKAVQNNGK